MSLTIANNYRYQPATDVIQEQLMREYNRNRVPIICGTVQVSRTTRQGLTVQAYLRRYACTPGL